MKALLQEIGRLTTRRSDAVLTRRSSHRSGGRTPVRRHDGVNIDDLLPLIRKTFDIEFTEQLGRMYMKYGHPGIHPAPTRPKGWFS